MANASNGNAYIPGGGGVGIAVGGATQTSGTVVFSNSNGVTFGYNNGTITATVTPGAAAGIAAIGAGTQTATSGTQVFSNSNNISFGMSGSTQITASVNVGVSAVSAGTTSVAGGAVVLSNSNGLTFGLNGSTITGSYTVPGATSFSNSNGVTFGLNGSTVTASYNSTSAAGQGTTFAGTNISASMTLNTAGLNLALSGAAAGGGNPNISAGTTSGNLGSIVFSNSNGVSFGLNGSTITASASGAGASATVFAQSQSTGQSSSSTYALSALNIAGYGIISVGNSGGTIQISGPATTNFANLSVSAGTTSNSLGSVVFSNSNGVSFGLNGSTITASAAGGGFTGGVSTGGNTSGNTGTQTGQMVFAGGNNITLSVSTAAGGAQTITISGANAGGAQTGISGLVVSNTTYTSGTVTFQNANGISFGSSGANGISASYTVPTVTQVSSVGLYALGNTTQNSSTTLDQRTLSFNALGAMTMGYSAGSIQVSAPATSSISATGQVSVAVNGSTISIGVPNYGTFSNAYFPYKGFDLAAGVVGQGSLLFDPVNLPDLTFDRLLIPIYNTNSAVSSGSHSLSFYAGIYSRNASTLSLVGSASGSTAVTHSGQAGSYSLYSGVRHFSMASASSLSRGQYWMAFGSRTSSAGADGSYYNMQLNNGSFTDALLSGVGSYGAIFGSSVNATNQFQLGQGYYTVSSTGMPASVAFSQLNGTASNAGNMQAIIFANSTV